MRDFIKKLSQFSIGSILGAIIGLITVPMTTYFISPEEFGRAGMFVLVQTLMASFVYLGIDQAYVREFHDEENKKNLFHNALIAPIMISLLVFIMFGFNTRFFSNVLFGEESYTRIIWLVGSMGIFIVFERFILLFIRMEEKALEYSLFNIILKILVLLATIFLLLFVRQDFLTVVYANIFGRITGDIVLFIKYRKLFNISGFTFDFELLKKLFLFGAPLIFAVGIGSVLSAFDKIALRGWSSFEQLGIYTAAFKLVSILLIIQASFTTFWTPTAYRWHKENKEIKNYKLVSDTILVVMSVGFISILLFRRGIIWILSPNYSEAQYILGFLCLFPLLYTLSETTTLGIVFSRKSHLNIWVSIAAAVSSVVLNFILVPIYGALGAAISTGLSYIVFFAVRTYFSFKLWEGFSTKRHILCIVMLTMLAFINLNSSIYVTTMNILAIVLILLINSDVVKVGIRTILAK